MPKKKTDQEVPQGGVCMCVWEGEKQGDHYNAVEGGSVSRLNLKWKGFHIRFLWKIPFHTSTNKAVPCSTVSVICWFAFTSWDDWWSGSIVVVFLFFLFPYFCPYWKHVSGNPWYATGVNISEFQSRNPNPVRSVASKRTAFFIQCRDIDFSIFQTQQPASLHG